MFKKKEIQTDGTIERYDAENKSEEEKAENNCADQESLFDSDGAFSESMVVEKEDIKIDSFAQTQDDEKTDSEKNLGNTAVFTFAKDKPEGTEIEHEELTVGELQDTAKDYYNATHSESVEGKVDELRKLADESFADEVFDKMSSDDFKEIFSDDGKNKKKNKKKKKRGVISDDDMAILMEEQESKKDPKDFSGEAFGDGKNDGVEYKNPFDVEEETPENDESEEDKLIKALGGESSEYKSFESVFGDDEPDNEYTSREQESVILKSLRNRAMSSMISIFVSVVMAILCFYFETAAGTKMAHPSFFEPGKYGVTYAFSMLQIMFISVIANLDGVKRAFLGLRPTKPSCEGFTALTLVVCTLHTVISSLVAYDSADLKSFCTIGCISLVFLSINSFVKAYTSLTSFCIAASKAPKMSSFSLGRDSLEAGSFEKYLDNDTGIVTIGKGNFVNGFFKKSVAVPQSGAKTFKISITIVFVAFVLAIVKGVLSHSLYGAFCTFSAVSLVSLPMNALISTALPFLVASVKAKKTQTAYIGEAACDAYENCGIISFDDTEVFPAKSVKVSSIRTYADNRIDKVILYMARIFDKLEGPLSFVFANSVQNIEDNDIAATIVEHFSNGVSVKIDNKEVLVGTDSFMKFYDIETAQDNIDESFLLSSGSIMYMSVDGALAAKFYIKYTMNRNFEAILHKFYEAGICVGIKSYDPCITTELVCANLKGSNYPVKVIKNHDILEGRETAQSTQGAIISLSGIHNFLKGFIRLDGLRNVYRTNSLVSVFSATVGVLLSIFLAVFGSGHLGIAFMTLFQLFWCLPTVLFSVFTK